MNVLSSQVLMQGLFIGDAFSSGYESKIEELRERFKRAKEGLKDSISYGLWELALDNSEFPTFRSACHL